MILKWKTPAGDLFGEVQGNRLLWCDFEERDALAADVRIEDLNIVLDGTPFQVEVWSVLQTIPEGEVWTYKDIAKALGRGGAAQAVGQAVGANKFALKVPCHRVVGVSKLGGYKWGLDKKKALLKSEGVTFDSNEAHCMRGPLA